MDLEKIILKTQEGFDSISDYTVLQSLSKFEQYVNESYEGRLFFELIQNARDAAFAGGIYSDIKIIVTPEKVLFANTGKPFDEKGILAMTRLGLSSKRDHELIGSKGIGFKSIQEFSKTPKIITEFGTLYFNQEKLRKKLDVRFPDIFDSSSVPLFYYPHYDGKKCEQVEEFKDLRFDTIIEFSLDRNKSWNKIVNLYKTITDEELILLGSIDSISFESKYFKKERLFKSSADGYVQCQSTTSNKMYKIFTPETAVEIPDLIYDEFDAAEKKTYEKERKIDIKLVFECTAEGAVLPKSHTKSKLYLFYPLETYSGFSYIIHSNFSCNPERTTIRNTRLNQFIFDQITTMQTTQILDYLLKQDYRAKLISFFIFERSDDKLRYFYKRYIEKLSTKRFIWIESISEYVSPAEVIFCPKEIYSFLKLHKIEGRYLFTSDEITKTFLIENFKIKTLAASGVVNYIEEIAQKESENPTFFEKAYSFLLRNNINASGRKILLGSNNALYSRSDDVFYIREAAAIKIPQAISSRLVSLHPEIHIKNEDLVKSAKLLGIRDYRSSDLVDKALTLFDSTQVDNFSILEFLVPLKSLSPLTKDTIQRRVFVPVKGKEQWVRPLYEPVYFESAELKELYPDGSYIDMDACLKHSEGLTAEDLKLFFSDYGIWEIPALFFSEKKIDTSTDPKRTGRINRHTGKNAYGYEITYDRLLDFPQKANYYFFDAICSNWALYEEKISNKNIFEFTARSTLAANADKFANCMVLTSFIKSLQEHSWIYLSEGQAEPLAAAYVTGLDRLDASAEKHLINKLNIFVIDYQRNKSFIDKLGIAHFNTFSSAHIIAILNKTAAKYSHREGEVLDTDFKRFYHAVLKYLYSTYAQIDSSGKDRLVKDLKNTSFLGKRIAGNEEFISWKEPQDIYHIDEKLIFESLPSEAKELLGSYFTKTDKNEIGRIFSRIGKRISDEVEEDLMVPESHSEYILIDKIPNLPFVIAAVEDKIESHIPDKIFDEIKKLKLRVTAENLTKRITLKSVDFKIDMPLRYSYDKKDSVYIAKKDMPLIDNKSLFGEILDSVLSEYLGRELGINRLIKDLLFGRGTKTFEEALQDMEYDKERITEIELIFNEHAKTPFQEFWSAVLFAKGIDHADMLCMKASKEKFESIAGHLSSDSDAVVNWIEKIDYFNLSASANYKLFLEIIKNENVSFDQVNLKLSKNISFEYLYAKEFERFKNRNLDALKWTLYGYFEKQDTGGRAKFHNAVISIEKLEPRKWERAIWNFDPCADLLEMLNRHYANLNLTRQDATDAVYGSSWKKLQGSMPQYKREFRSILKNEGFILDNFEAFINEEKNYSLLYFKSFDILKDNYVSLYGVTEAKSRDSDARPHGFPAIEQDSSEIVSCRIEESPLGNPDAFNHALKNMRGGGTRQSGSGTPMLLNQNYLNYIGEQGERLLYLKLIEIYNGNVTWVSENAKSMGFVSDKEALGYDMRYIDQNNETHYVEVKTSTGEEPEFHISINEIRAAKKYGARYHVVWITNLLYKDRRKYYNLNNMFIDFKDGEDFFHNRKFFPHLTAFKIAFKLESISAVQQQMQNGKTAEAP